MTIQQICDRLAEEAGWVWINTDKFTPSEGFWCDGKDAKTAHPFPPDSIDAAVRGVPERMDYAMARTGKNHACSVDHRGTGEEWYVEQCDHPAHAVYFAIAKARGWM